MSVKAVFLDRDGVINQFPGNGKYVTKLKEFRFVPGSLDALRILTQEGYSIFVVSNQAGVAKGVYSKQKLEHITRNMLRDIRAVGGKIKEVFYCTHFSHAGCECRKPEIGAIRTALESSNKTLVSIVSIELISLHLFFIDSPIRNGILKGVLFSVITSE